MKTIKVKIDKKTGTTVIAPEGFGADCMKETKKLEDALGMNETDREMTPEYYQEIQNNQTNG